MSLAQRERVQEKIRELRLAAPKKKKRAKWVQTKGLISQEREYFRDINVVLKKFKDIVDRLLIKRLPTIERTASRDIPIVNKDSYGDDINDIILDIGVDFEREVTKDDLARIARRRGVIVYSVQRIAFENNWRRVVGTDRTLSEAWANDMVQAFALNNAQLISSVPRRTLDEISNIVLQGFTEGQRWETISESIQDRFNVMESRADLIARDQVNKLNASVTEARQTDLGIKRYIWRTMGDDRVRESHREKEGNIYSWDDPPSDTGHPGQEINCRCYGEPVIEDLLVE